MAHYCQALYQELQVRYIVSSSHRVHELLLLSLWKRVQRSNLPNMTAQPCRGAKSQRRWERLVLSGEAETETPMLL